MKHCSSCNTDKQHGDFYKNHRTKDGFAYTCKACMADYSAKYREKNKLHRAELKRRWYIKNKNRIAQYSADYYVKNKNTIIDKAMKYRKERLKSDPLFKLQKNLRHRLNKLIKQKTSRAAIDFLGCDLDYLKTYLESQFQPGMTWYNYGMWHVDHIKPLSRFDLLDPEQLKKACHYTNLQPLWAEDNLKKSNRI